MNPACAVGWMTLEKRVRSFFSCSSASWRAKRIMNVIFTISAGWTVMGKFSRRPTPSLLPISFTPSQARLPFRVRPKGVRSSRMKPKLNASSHFHFFPTSDTSMLESRK